MSCSSTFSDVLMLNLHYYICSATAESSVIYCTVHNDWILILFKQETAHILVGGSGCLVGTVIAGASNYKL